MSFFDSEIVREELEIINELQNDIFQELSTFQNQQVCTASLNDDFSGLCIDIGWILLILSSRVVELCLLDHDHKHRRKQSSIQVHLALTRDHVIFPCQQV